MGWSVTELTDGTWEYECFNSAYGLVLGGADTFAEALVRLSAAEADLFEQPWPPRVLDLMLEDPSLLSVDSEGLIEVIGRHVFPIDADVLRAQLRS